MVTKTSPLRALAEFDCLLMRARLTHSQFERKCPSLLVGEHAEARILGDCSAKKSSSEVIKHRAASPFTVRERRKT